MKANVEDDGESIRTVMGERGQYYFSLRTDLKPYLVNYPVDDPLSKPPAFKRPPRLVNKEDRWRRWPAE
jgi:hypothetical protein